MKMEKRKVIAKKAQAHVELIISFVIFVGFVVAIFVFINPFSRQTLTYAAMDKIQDKILTNISINYSSINLIIQDSNPPTNCLEVDPPGIGINPIIKDSDSAIKKYKLAENKLNIEAGGDYKLYKFYFSNSFNGSLTPNPSCSNPIISPTIYSYGAPYTDTAVLYENIISLNKTYMDNYGALKTQLGIENDFEFVVLNETNGIVFDTSSKHKVKNRIVLSRMIPLVALDRSATQKQIIINLRIW